MTSAQEKLAKQELKTRAKSGRNRLVFGVLCVVLMSCLGALYYVYFQILQPKVANLEYDVDGEKHRIGDIKVFKKNFGNITPVLTAMLSLMPLYVLLANPLAQTVKGNPLNNMTLVGRVLRLILGIVIIGVSLMVPSALFALQPYRERLIKYPDRYVQLATFVGMSVLIILNLVSLRSTIGSFSVMMMVAPKLFLGLSSLLAGGGAVALQNVFLGTGPAKTMTEAEIRELVNDELNKRRQA